MKVAILGKINKSDPTEYITNLITLLEKRNVSVFLECNYFNSLNGFISKSISSFEELDKSYDLLISIGGDGTILKAITFVKDLSIPIIGVNSGRLGFLAKIQIDNIEQVIEEIISGMVKACRETNVSLVGGETAEMPDTYLPGEHDLVGVITGVVDKEKIITGEKIKPGDLIFGLPSNGLHTNGYSLARKIFFDIGG